MGCFSIIYKLILKFENFMSLTLVTSLGDIKMELFCELCPKTCKNFLALAGSGFYNNTIFHRNIPGFII